MRFAWGHLSACGDRTAPHPASYDWQNRRFVWQPARLEAARFAFDVERLDTPAPTLLLHQPMPRFLRAWTRLEVLAKLTDEPVLSLVRRKDLLVPPLDTPYSCTSTNGAKYLLHTGIWPERHLVFTCGFQVA